MKGLDDYVPPRTAANYQHHVSALRFPFPGYEKGFVDMLRGLQMYVSAVYFHQHPVNDSYTTPALGAVIEGLESLLSADIGHRLDAGSLDSFLHDTAQEVGWCMDHSQMLVDCSHPDPRDQEESEEPVE